MPTSASTTDVLHRSIHVAAPAEVVWRAIEQAGWGAPGRADADLRVEAVEVRPPHYLAFRHHFDDEAGAPTSLVEVVIPDTHADDTRVRVSESGFGAWNDAEAAVRAHSRRMMAWEDALEDLRRGVAPGA